MKFLTFCSIIMTVGACSLQPKYALDPYGFGVKIPEGSQVIAIVPSYKNHVFEFEIRDRNSLEEVTIFCFLDVRNVSKPACISQTEYESRGHDSSVLKISKSYSGSVPNARSRNNAVFTVLNRDTDYHIITYHCFINSDDLISSGCNYSFHNRSIYRQTMKLGL